MFRKASVLLLASALTFSCATTDDDPNAKAKRGAAVGAAVGAIAGAILGNQAGGQNHTGAAVGAIVGAAIGGAAGHRMDQQQKELQQIPDVEVTRPAENQIDVRLTSDVLFDYNSATLRPESYPPLNNLADNFKRYPEEIIDVEGHTDAMGSDDYNQNLSERRAFAVKDYLVDRGVAANRINAVGFGKTRPKASNDTPEGRQLNRRVEIHIRSAQ